MQAYGAQQRSVALQVVVLHFEASDAPPNSPTAVTDKTTPAYAHTQTTINTSSARIVRLMSSSLDRSDVFRLYQRRVGSVKEAPSFREPRLDPGGELRRVEQNLGWRVSPGRAALLERDVLVVSRRGRAVGFRERGDGRVLVLCADQTTNSLQRRAPGRRKPLQSICTCPVLTRAQRAQPIQRPTASRMPRSHRRARRRVQRGVLALEGGLVIVS